MNALNIQNNDDNHWYLKNFELIDFEWLHLSENISTMKILQIAEYENKPVHFHPRKI